MTKLYLQANYLQVIHRVLRSIIQLPGLGLGGVAVEEVPQAILIRGCRRGRFKVGWPIEVQCYMKSVVSGYKSKRIN